MFVHDELALNSWMTMDTDTHVFSFCRDIATEMTPGINPIAIGAHAHCYVVSRFSFMVFVRVVLREQVLGTGTKY